MLRLVAAFLSQEQPQRGEFIYKFFQVPDSIWCSLLPRGDDLIGYQEFLAVALAIGTFVTPGSMVIVFIDNDGVLGSVIKGSS